jgi:hypothetical protein
MTGLAYLCVQNSALILSSHHERRYPKVLRILAKNRAHRSAVRVVAFCPLSISAAKAGQRGSHSLRNNVGLRFAPRMSATHDYDIFKVGIWSLHSTNIIRSTCKDELRYGELTCEHAEPKMSDRQLGRAL